MRRRLKLLDPDILPPDLLAFAGSTWPEARKWLEAREAWWDSNHNAEEVGDLQWLFDGLAQVPPPPFCGSTSGLDCDDPNCCCIDHYATPLEGREPA